ncbi:MAG: histidine phosphatase family protein [Planctomycetaceae bacterium]
MKTLFLLRHAKSSWKNDLLTDHERPLNKRGRTTAPLMGRFMAEKDLQPDVIVSSTALRAKQTTDLIVESSQFPADVQFTDELYPSGVSRCLSALQTYAGGSDAVMLVGHNPGLEEVLEVLTGRYDRMPTCALAKIALSVADWAEVSFGASGELIGMWRPRELFERE